MTDAYALLQYGDEKCSSVWTIRLADKDAKLPTVAAVALANTKWTILVGGRKRVNADRPPSPFFVCNVSVYATIPECIKANQVHRVPVDTLHVCGDIKPIE